MCLSCGHILSICIVAAPDVAVVALRVFAGGPCSGSCGASVALGPARAVVAWGDGRSEPATVPRTSSATMLVTSSSARVCGSVALLLLASPRPVSCCCRVPPPIPRDPCAGSPPALLLSLQICRLTPRARAGLGTGVQLQRDCGPRFALRRVLGLRDGVPTSRRRPGNVRRRVRRLLLHLPVGRIYGSPYGLQHVLGLHGIGRHGDRRTRSLLYICSNGPGHGPGHGGGSTGSGVSV